MTYLDNMPDGLLELFSSLFSIAILFVVTWLMTKFYAAKRLEVKFAVPSKDGVLAMGYVIAAFIALAIVLAFWTKSLGGPIVVTEEYDILRVSYEWVIYAVISFVPILVVLNVKHQSFESVGATSKNLRLSVAVGVALSMVWLALNATPEQFLSRVGTSNTFYALLYFLAVGFGEELLFRGFLQLRCSAWLGEVKGLVVASVIMAFAHVPQRVFVAGLGPVEAVFSATVLLPISLFMGFFMLRTQNVVGPAVLHTILDLTNVL